MRPCLNPTSHCWSPAAGQAIAEPALPLGRPGWDALLLAVLLLARLRINTLAEAGLFEHFQNVTGHSLLGSLLSDQAEAAFGPWFGDPIALLLAALSLAALLVYLVIDLAAADRAGQRRHGIRRPPSGPSWPPGLADHRLAPCYCPRSSWPCCATRTCPTATATTAACCRPRRPSTSSSAAATPTSRTTATPPWPTGACPSSARRWTTTPTCRGPSSSLRRSSC